MIVDQARYRDGERMPCVGIRSELEQVRADRATRGARGSDFIWVGMKDPSAETFDRVADEELHLHPLAVEDAVQGDQRPKLERYGEGYFVVLRPLRYLAETREIESGELMLFLEKDVLLTVRRGDASPLGDLRTRLEQDQPEALDRGPWGVFWAILDHVVDQYLLIEDRVQDDLEALERRVFAGDRTISSGEIYHLKREVLEFKRAALPLHRAMRSLLGPMSPLAEDDDLRLYFRDVADHLSLVIDNTESQDRLLSDMLSAHLAQVGVQQNEDMRRISAWVAIAAVPTMIAGVYGMNFERMPELTASIDVGGRELYYGYYVVLVVMVLVCLGLYRVLYRHGWLGPSLSERIREEQHRLHDRVEADLGGQPRSSASYSSSSRPE